MSTLPEQFSAARASQVDAQLNLLHDFTARAIESTRQIMALNLATTRAQVAQSTAAMCQLMSVGDPRELISLTTQTQATIDTMLQYGRALAGIASQPSLPQVVAKAAAKAPPQAELQAPPQAELSLETPTTFTPEIAPELAPKAAVASRLATPKPIAKAASTVAAKEPARPAAAPVPAAAKPVVVTGVKAPKASPQSAPAPAAARPAVQAKAKPAVQTKAKPAVQAKGAATGHSAPAAKSKLKKSAR